MCGKTRPSPVIQFEDLYIVLATSAVPLREDGDWEIGGCHGLVVQLL